MQKTRKLINKISQPSNDEDKIPFLNVFLASLKVIIHQFQSPWRYIIFAILTSFVIKIPMFFQFELTHTDGITHYWTTALMNDSGYISFTSYWDELFTTGILPLATTVFFNIRIYLKVRKTLALTLISLFLFSVFIIRKQINN